MCIRFVRIKLHNEIHSLTEMRAHAFFKKFSFENSFISKKKLSDEMKPLNKNKIFFYNFLLVLDNVLLIVALIVFFIHLFKTKIGNF